jgi:hypothetical protein
VNDGERQDGAMTSASQRSLGSLGRSGGFVPSGMERVGRSETYISFFFW